MPSHQTHFGPIPANRWLAITACVLFVLSIALGCEKKPAPIVESVTTQIDIPDPLVVLVIGDPVLGPRIARQWTARREGSLTIIDQTDAEFKASQYNVSKNVDVVIYPPAILGELASRFRLRVIPEDFLGSNEYNKLGLLRHFRTSVVRHQNDSWAVPLGSPNFAMLLNRKLFESITPPESWDQLDRALAKIADSDKAGQFEAKIDLPLAKGWAVQSFLARVASSIRYQGKLSTLFDRSTMDPLIAEPPFVEALEQMVAVASQRSLELDPAGVFNFAKSGQSAIAISWPALGFSNNANDRTQTDGQTDGQPSELSAVESSEDTLQIIPLPGSQTWYDAKAGTWNKRSREDDIRVDLVGFSGLVASVSADCPNERSAWDFLQWLPSESISKLTMVESPRVGPFRASHLGDMERWTGDSISEDVAFEYADVIAANHERSLVLMFPRITGSQQYVDALDEAVRSAISGDQTAVEALSAASKKWDAITESIGRRIQILELRKESGL